MHNAPLVSLPDHAGDSYIEVLARLHRHLRPRSYFEIGTQTGQSLLLAKCASIAVDPAFAFNSPDPVTGKPLCALYETTSDDFFANADPTLIFGRAIDFAFLDGMHRSEFLLRDFANTERHCKANSIIAMHDCIPVEHLMTERNAPNAAPIAEHRVGWWTGDVWRTILALKKYRPELRITALDAPPTGLIVATNLDPASTLLFDRYSEIRDWMFSQSLEEHTLEKLYLDFNVESTASLALDEQITARFWL